MRDLLRSEYSEVWRWFSSVKAKSEYNEHVELELLKSTYRMEREAHENLYQLTDSVRSALEISTSVTLYQSQGSSHSSAALYFTADHAHIVFMGGLLELLDDDETKSVIAHELSHFKLWTLEDAEYLICDQVLTAMVNEPRAESAHHESARNYQLYTEVYADRGSLMVVDDEVAVSALLKVHTGIKNANAASYMKQAEDLFSKESHTTEGLTHPELFIRVRAIQMMELAANEPERYQDEIQKLIQGNPSIDELDMLSQHALTEHTRLFLLHHLQPAWLRTDAIMGHVGYFFPDLDFTAHNAQPFEYDLINAHPKTREYFSYLLTDIIATDPDLDENGIAAAILTADSVGILSLLEKQLNKQLKILKKDITRIKRGAKETVRKAKLEAEQEAETSSLNHG